MRNGSRREAPSAVPRQLGRAQLGRAQLGRAQLGRAQLGRALLDRAVLLAHSTNGRASGRRLTRRSGSVLSTITPDRAPVALRLQRKCSATSAPGRNLVGMDTTTPTTHPYPVRFSVEYPERPLERLTTALRAVVAIPILVALAVVSGGIWQLSNDSGSAVAAAGGLLFAGPLLMIVFRRKYPRWWFDWNLELQRFTNRVWAYLALMDDRYPSTTDRQSVSLEYDYPDASRDLNRWLPLVKWLLAIPHYAVLVVLHAAAAVLVIAAWFAIVVTGRYPRWIFEFVTGVLRWDNRVIGYAFTLVTDRYPPFRLA